MPGCRMRAPLRAGLVLLLASIDNGNAQSAQEFTVLQRVDVAMEYHWKRPKGLAAVQWTTLREATGLSVKHMKVALAGFLYARTIVIHAETRRALIERTQPAAMGLVQGGERFAMDDWRLETGGLSFPIYPWQSVAPDRVQSARTYTAYLIERSDGFIGGHLELAVGYERILAPAAPLIVFEALTKGLAGPERVLLGRVILLINDFYSRRDLGDTARLLGSEGLVTTVVVQLLRDERSFASRRSETKSVSRAKLQTLSEALATNMGNLFDRQRACGLQSNISPDRAAGLFINYMSESEVQSVMESYAAGMKVTAGQPCNRVAVGQSLIVMMTEMRTYIKSARPFLKKW